VYVWTTSGTARISWRLFAFGASVATRFARYSGLGMRRMTAYGTHSMRRTKVTQIYKKTDNLRAVQLLLGHTKMDSTVRYLGVELEDALAISEAIEI
jgi:site-specific recombinase XerC